MSATEQGLAMVCDLPEKLVSVCAWCFPNPEDYFRAHPENRNRVLTHTICRKHLAQVLDGTYRREKP